MLVTPCFTLEPYEVDFYIMSTEGKEENKKANQLFHKKSKSLGIDVFGSDDDDGRDYISAFASGYKRKRITACIYIRNKKIDESSLDHELIHCLNFVNERFGVSSKFGEDESTSYFFEYLKRSVLKILKTNGIKLTKIKL